MELLKRIDELLIGWGMNPATADWLDQFITFMLVLLLAFVADFICRKVLLRAIARLVQKTKATWDDILFDRRVMGYLSHMVAPVIIYLFIPVVFADTDSVTLNFIRRLCYIVIILSFLFFINAFLKAAYTVYSEKESMRDRAPDVAGIAVDHRNHRGRGRVAGKVAPVAAGRTGSLGRHPDAGVQGQHHGLRQRRAALGQ